MDEKTLPDFLSNLIPDPIEDQPGTDKRDTDQQKNILVEGLKAMAGQTGGPLQQALEDFLGGKGELHETTRSAASRGKKSAEAEIITLLTKQFNLSPMIAKLIAPMLIKLIPSIGAGAEQEKPAKEESAHKVKPKSQPKTKPKTETKPKTQNSSSKKKKTPSKPKKTTAVTKKASSKTTSKKKTSEKSSKKDTKPKAK